MVSRNVSSVIILKVFIALCLIGENKIELQKGYGIFINSGVLHRFEAQNSTLAPNIVFSPILLAIENSLIYEKYILPIINSSISYQVLSPCTTCGKQMLQLLSKIFTTQDNEQNNELWLFNMKKMIL